jgi:hypothetical protein
MTEGQSKVKKVKVRKPKPPTFKNRLIRLQKHRYINDKWLRNSLIFAVVIIFISISFFGFSAIKKTSSYDKDRKDLEALKNDELRRKALREQVEQQQRQGQGR